MIYSWQDSGVQETPSALASCIELDDPHSRFFGQLILDYPCSEAYEDCRLNQGDDRLRAVSLGVATIPNLDGETVRSFAHESNTADEYLGIGSWRTYLPRSLKQ